MSFSTEIFIFLYLPTLLISYMFLNQWKLRNIILLVMSFIFYAWGGVGYCGLMLVLITINYLFGLHVRDNRIVMYISVFFNIGILVLFKYSSFILMNIKRVFSGISWIDNLSIPSISQPIGISFFCFAVLSYLFDIYYGKIQPEKKISSFSLYALFFSKVMSGPIVRYIDIKEELSDRTFCFDEVYSGLKRFGIGFIKKILLSNQMALVADTAFSIQGSLHPVYAWIGAISYMLNIYLDFSSYSDMAIGLAQIFGFHFKENFNYPYISSSIKEFWRRWHISLSSWFRDYVYIPLGGNRKGKKRTYINLLVVFFLTGLWHGASWNFIAWGMYNGIFLLIERKTNFCEKLPKVIAHIYTLIVVLIGWVFFKAESLSNAINYLANMLGICGGNISNLEMIRVINTQYVVFGFASILATTPLLKRIAERIKYKWFKDCIILILFFVSLCYMIASDYNPFIYFRF